MFYDLAWKKIVNILIISGLLLGALVITMPPIIRQGTDFFRVYFEKTRISFQALVYRLDYFLGSDEVLPVSGKAERARAVPVLVYHGVLAESDGENVSAKMFQDQMFALKRAGWQTVRLQDFYSFFKGERDLPDKSFLLTFDDGRKDSFYPVDPILMALDYNAVNFVITRVSITERGSYYLSLAELIAMENSGRWEIESHGKDAHILYPVDDKNTPGHFLTNKLWLSHLGRTETDEEFRERIRGDLSESKKEIEESLGKKVTAFAFPFGDYGQNTINFQRAKPVINELVKSTYPLVFFQAPTWSEHSFNYPEESSFLVKRLNIEPYWSGSDLVQILERGRPRELPFTSEFNDTYGWMINWGLLRPASGGVALTSKESGTGSAIFLDGTYDWLDYDFSADVDLVKGRSVSLLARFQDSANYVVCTFSPDFVHMEQFLDGEGRVIRGIRDKIPIPEGVFELNMHVKGRDVECRLNGKTYVDSHFLDERLRSGGIGFKTWDPEPENSQIFIDRVRVDPL